MSWLYEAVVRPMLFRMHKDPESAHEQVLGLLEWLAARPMVLDLVASWSQVEEQSTGHKK